MKLFTSIFLFALISVSAVFSQSAEIVEKTVSTEKLTYGTAAYFTAVAMGYISDDDSEEDAVDAWKKIGEQYSKPAIEAEISRMILSTLKILPGCAILLGMFQIVL